MTLARLAQWTRSADLESAAAQNSSQPILQIAEGLTIGPQKLERQLLLKSLQETLFYCVGFDPELRYPEVLHRIRQYLARQGPEAIFQRFLALHFFNFIWYHTGESFRVLAWTADAFEKDMETVERLCQKAVMAEWNCSEVVNVTA